ncbi:hypothetical protein DV495_002327 [Geotrichum candidum]|uniref:Diphthamide biosynthesis protein 4 n=1 Tax=Geotrichum candidum TaxID=1173061 RepID=A0A0J9XGP2_GEOCN|nr:hypothetical protein DV454_002197 [Geotrichum candidum]KAF5119409.1 hypothetical protein DV452_001708 [Geotrichum candidum]KAF5129381.1 hypothetical protein DV495_002327 [Geotrichum candidum]KAF7500977.1 hypothetical protein DV113_000949 [Geotrichum candidum]CDO56577.1 Conserved hypothetical protein [Geotrichum candidum]
MSNNYYELLGVYRSEPAAYSDVPLSEIKQGYHAALLDNHPDKQQQQQQTGSAPLLSIPLIKAAFAVLSNAAERAEYDKKLITGGGVAVASAGLPPRATGCTMDLSELTIHEDDPENFRWTSACRCGEDEGYALTERDLEANGDLTSIVVQCVGCSLWIEVQYDIEEE